jgi:predicted short-subunit dehydrogenase-like oxidoreductase (DUF2520 family)
LRHRVGQVGRDWKRGIDIEPSAKTVFRAATVFAGSYLITMLDVALQAWCRAGLPEAVAMPIMQS